jgi:hypothetical protein
MADMVFNVTCNTLLFETWVENFLIKDPKSRQFVVMDHAAFHQSKKSPRKSKNE